MKKIFSRFTLLLLIVSFFATPDSSKASHYMGLDITYECIGSCTIRVYLRVYRDCTGISIVSNSAIFLSPPGCNPPVPIGAWSPEFVQEVTPICPGILTCCDYAPPCPAGVYRGVQEYYYWRDFDFCSANCTNYTIAWDDCCRNSAITSITSPGSASLTSSSTVVNPMITPCNSSPQFNNPPVPYICENQPFTFNQSATDPDGDSIAYYIGPCFDGMDSIAYKPGYSSSAPLGPDWIVSIDSITGDISIIPNPASATPGSIQVGVLCVYVEEWRGGVLIGTVYRDMQVTVVPCTNTLPTIPGMTSVTGGVMLPSGFSASMCSGDTLCFLIPTNDPDLGDTLSVWWNSTLPTGLFFDPAFPATLDTVRGVNPVAAFCFVPPAPGYYSFLVTVRDNSCPFYGQNQYTFGIYVEGPYIHGNWTVTSCQTVAFCIDSINANDPFFWSWSGAGGLSSLDSCFSYMYPATGSFPFTLTITDSVGCDVPFRDTVVLPSFIFPDAGPDQAICSGDTVIIGGPPIPDALYSWSPTAGLSDPSVINPSLSLTNITTAPTTHSYILFVTDTISGCTESDTMVLTVNPYPIADFTLQDSACAFDVTTVTFTGTAAPGASYSWDFGAAGSPAAATGAGPHNVSWSAGGFQTVTLQVVQFGCSSSVDVDSIQINPIPTAVIGPVADQCYDFNSFDFTSTGVYSSSATFIWNFSSAIPSVSFAENPAGVVFTAPGTHWATLIVQDRGCTSSKDSVSFLVSPNPDPAFSILSDPAQCFNGNNYVFQSTGVNPPGTTFLWDFGSTGTPTSSVNPLDSTTFSTWGTIPVTLTLQYLGCTESLTVNVVVNPDPIVDAGLPVAFCEGEGGAQLQSTVTVPGTAPYYYTWWCDSVTAATYCGLDSVFDDDPIGSPDASTWYYVQVTDFNGCLSNIDSVWVEVIPKPIVDAGPDVWLCQPPAPCQQFNATVSGSPGPFSYQWYTGSGLSNDTIPNPCVRPDTTTIYYLVVTDLTTGCTSDASTTDTLSSAVAHVHPLPIADAGPDRDICFGDTVMLMGIGYDAGPSYAYEWSPYTMPTSISANNIPNPLAFPDLTTEYILTVWSNGCPSYGDTVRVNVHTQPTVDAGPDRDICVGETAFLDGSASGDPTATYTYAWTPATGVTGSTLVEDLLASPPSTTMYYVQATSNWGCESASDSALVTVKSTPQMNPVAPLQICRGDSITLPVSYTFGATLPAPASEVSISWNPNVNINDTSIIAPTVWPNSTMYYVLTLQHNTCITDDSVLVTVIPSPVPQITADTTVLCEGLSTQLHVTGGLGGATFEWTPPAGLSDPFSTDPIASPASTTTYTVTAQEGGCTATGEITLTVYQQPQAGYISSQTTGCAPLTVSFTETSSDDLFWIWDFGDGSPVSNDPSPVHVYMQAAVHTVQLIVTNLGGCSDTISSLVVNTSEGPTAEFTATPAWPAQLQLPATQVQFNDLSQNAVSWLWNFGDGLTSQDVNPQHTWMEPGEYSVTLTVTNPDGCIDQVVHGPFMILAPDLFIPNVFSPNGDGINDEWRILYTGSQPFHATVYDRWGVALYSSTDRLGAWNGAGSTGEPAVDGVYFYSVSIGGKEYTGNVSLIR